MIIWKLGISNELFDKIRVKNKIGIDPVSAEQSKQQVMILKIINIFRYYIYRWTSSLSASY